MLSIQLFGTPQLTLDGVAVKLTRRKSRALVYYWAAHSQPLTRDHLLAFFWPDTPRASAQQILRTTLHGLRKALGASLVVAGDAIALALDTQVDARDFERALASLSNLQPPRGASNLQSLTSALDLYTGEFLADVSLPDTPAFDDWVVVQREHYRRLAVRGLTAISRQHEAAGEYAAALASLDRALAFDALQEDLQREAIRLLYLSGDRPAAIRRYDQLRKLLDDELGMPPMAETRMLYDEILADALSKTADRSQRPPVGRPQTAAIRFPISDLRPPTSEALPFAGRAAEMQQLREWSARAVRPLVLIEGEAGIGKTRLAAEFIHTGDSIALAGAAHELEQALPYQPIIEALRGLVSRAEWPALRAVLQSSLPAVWLAEVARLLPELDVRAGTTADESRLWEGLHQFLRALARQRPVVVFLDDLHWADASTLALLGYLARQTARAPVFLLATTRPITARSTLGTLLQSLTREGRLERLALARLSAHEVSTFARHLSAQYAPPLAEWLMRHSEGNPYMLAELIRHAREMNLLGSGGVLNLTMLASAPSVPQTVYSLIQSRLAKLSDAARRVLDVAVAVGREFDFDVVVRAAGLSESAALDALDELRDARLILPATGTRYTFDHTLTMEVAYRETGEPRHRLWHRRVAEALEATPRDRLDLMAGLIAWHFVEGNAPDRAAPYSFRAGEQAAQLAAWREAIAFFEQALGASDKSERHKILMALGQAYMRAGEDARASEVFREALPLAQARGDADQIEVARLALAQSFLPQARFAEALALAQQVGASRNPCHRLDAESIRGTALSLEGADLAGAAEHLRRAESLCTECADAARLAHVKFELGSVAAQQGELDQAITLYREALDAASSTDTQAALNWRILAHNNLAYHLHLLGDASAESYARAGLALAQEKGVLNLQTYLLSTLGEIALAGDVESAEKHFAQGLALAERLAIPERIAGLTANLGRVAAQRGETALAIHRFSTALARADMLGTQHLAAQIRVWLAPLLPPSEARARLAEARAIAGPGHRQRLLEEIDRMETELS
jgi:DNA-binding SARP family transcriptional activator